jgi:hypothetical protein
MSQKASCTILCIALGLVGFVRPVLGAPIPSFVHGDSAPRNSNGQIRQSLLNTEANSVMEGSISRQNSEDVDFPNFRLSRSAERKSGPSAERYPSPHGKNARWRFDLRHTVDSDSPVYNTVQSQLPSSPTLQRVPSRNVI